MRYNMSWYLTKPIDFKRHNEENKLVWRAYRQGKPYRVPVIVSGSIRNLFENLELNNTGYTFEDFFKNPEAQIKAQLAYQKWIRYNLICDREMGPPREGWSINVDFQNSYEQGWFGCPLKYNRGYVPDTVEILKEDKYKLYEMDSPDPLKGNLLGRAMEFFEYMEDKCPKMEFEGLPVNPPKSIPGEGTDGPFTVAAKIRGTTELCIDMYEDPKYFHDLLNFVTENSIRRMKAIREWRWKRFPNSPDKGKYKMPNWGFADDSIALLSVASYKEFILPYHKRLVEEFSDGGHIRMHLCGDATHLFKFLKEELNVYSFDTGFPVDFGKLREELGPEVEIYGGPNIMLLKDGPATAIKSEVERICKSGIMNGRRFVLREGNNLAPCTPIEHIEAMYEAGKRFGHYETE